MEILIALLVLGVIILVHELGHFIAAKLCGMPVKEFAIGMGPDVYSYQGKETKYSFKAIPMGGFVSIAGMEIDSKDEDGFNSKSPLQRFIVLFSGVLMNFLLAYVLIFVMLIFNGKVTQNNEPIVGEILKTSAAVDVIQKNDRVRAINGEKIQKWDDISRVLKTFNEGEDSKNRFPGTERKVELTLERENKVENISAKLTYEPESKRYFLGIVPEVKVEKYNFSGVFIDSGKVFGKIFGDTFNGFKMLITGKVKKEEVSGPLGIIKVVGDASRGGAGVLIWLTIMLAINVGIFNLLPFPALDGGRIIFVLLELMGINVNKKVEERVHTVGMLILIALIIYVTGNDIMNLFRR